MSKTLEIINQHEGTIEEEITGVCHTAVPEIFCRSRGLLVIDTGTQGYNPLEFVRFPDGGGLEANMGLCTREDNHPKKQSEERWWHQRDPMLNGEYAYIHSYERPDGNWTNNLIVLYWENVFSPPLIQYGLWKDRAIKMVNCSNLTVRLRADLCGVGLSMYNCDNIRVEELHVSNSGRGYMSEKSVGNAFESVTMENIAHIPFHPSKGSGYGKIAKITLDTCGISKSHGGFYPSSRSDVWTVDSLTAHKQCFGRFFVIDGAPVFFENFAGQNTVTKAHISNCFNAVQDNSGEKGNRVRSLCAINCTNTLDVSDAEGSGNGDPADKILEDATLISSGPFGVRTPDIGEVKIIGNHEERRKRWAHEAYPDLPQYSGFRWRKDAINVPLPIPAEVP